MKLFLIRHGETVDNVRGVYAGITDSALTNHGVLQANRLGRHLADRAVKVAHIFSSDLQRARRTAEAIRLAQPNYSSSVTETKQRIDLREQDFGFYEGRVFYERPKDSSKSGKDTHLDAHRNEPGFIHVESRDAMKVRSNRFIDEHLLSLLESTEDGDSIVIVAHGIILSHLWRCILGRFPISKVSIVPGAVASDRQLILEHLGGWSNTGYLELDINKMSTTLSSVVSPNKRKRAESSAGGLPSGLDVSSNPSVRDLVDYTAQLPPTPAPLAAEGSLTRNTVRLIPDMTLVVKAVNCQDHLKGLKKTRGGIGSLKHDEGQKTIESFFKKRKTD